MSRIGKHPIVIPAGVEVGRYYYSKKKWSAYTEFSDVTVTVVTKSSVDRSSDHKDQRAKHGLYRSLINNMVVGVTEGFTNH
jgi:large subunit ribosomal protein L6